MTDETIPDNGAPITPVADPLQELVGEGKKFKSVEDLAKSKVEADRFIDKLKDENDALRKLVKDSERTTNMTSAIERLLASVTKSEDESSNQTAAPSPVSVTNQDNMAKAISAEDVVKIVHAVEEQRRMVANEQQALNTLSKKYGDKADEVLASRAAELGMDKSMLVDMARRNPKAFSRLIGEDGPTNAPMSNVSPRNSAAVLGNHPGNNSIRNSAFYENLKKTMGNKKFILDRSLQVQMHNDMTTLGERWDS
jgi:predicted DNA-binding ribbon-helix-helix protein